MRNDIELQPNAIINDFTIHETQDLNLRCIGTYGHGLLQWETRNVEMFPDILDHHRFSSSDELTIQYLSNNKRDTVLELETIASNTMGSYICKSNQSHYKTKIYISLQNPYFAFTSPVERNLSVPLGVKVTFTANYAYSSNGSHNHGPSYQRALSFKNDILDDGILDSTRYQYNYSIFASVASSGPYLLKCEFL